MLAVFSVVVALADQAPLISAPSAAGERLLVEVLPASLDARLAFAYRLGRSQGPGRDGALHWLLGSSVDETAVRVTIRLAGSVSRSRAAGLEERGCRLDRLESGEAAAVGPVVAGRCSWDALWRLAAWSEVLRVEPTFDAAIVRPAPPPQDDSAREVEAIQLSQRFAPSQGRGKGVVVADMDSGVSPFHPFFFRADGGAYPWIDANGNGQFDPGVDAVDFNRNGVKELGETLGIIKSRVTWLDWYTGQTTHFNTDAALLAGYDYLFQDENGDGQRNQGSAPPYGDGKPTFGEQLYLVDDVNGNGRLDREERLLRLQTPKIRAVRTPTVPGGPSQVYRRGVNLSQVPEPHAGAFDHGTMVLGTLAGGEADVTRYVGIAPEAELLLASTRSSSLTTDLAWALAEGAQLVLWEMSTWYGEFLDGSSNLEVACDQASAQGALQMGAAGNLGGSLKHRVMTHGSGTQVVPLVVPPSVATYAYGNFLWRQQSGALLSFSVTVGGQTQALSGTQGGPVQVGGAMVQWQRAVSLRQSEMLVFYIYAPTGTLAGQTMSFTVLNTGGPVALHGYVTDNYSSWSRGVAWDATTNPTDRGTYGTPGTADSTLAVATYYFDLLPTGATRGDLARYSGQGPRIDGLDSVDFAAPEDHLTAYTGQGVPFASTFIGGGTSNALPVAAGVAAILKGLGPGATPTALAGQLRGGALVEALMGTMPNDRWGAGKLRAHRAHYAGTAAPANGVPTARGVVAWAGPGVLLLDASASTDPEGRGLRYRWDLDYDGTYDLGPSSVAAQTAAAPSGTPWVKLEVQDDLGASARLILPVGSRPDAGIDGGFLDGGADAGWNDGGSDGGATESDAGRSDGGADAGGGGGYYVVPMAPWQLGRDPSCGCGSDAALAPLGVVLLSLLRRRRG